MPLRNIRRTVSPLHHSVRRALQPVAAVLALGVAGLAVACAEGPTAPAPAAAPSLETSPATTAAPSPETSLSETAATVKTLMWSQPATQKTVSATIGSAGGKISMGGLTLTVPRGAVSANTSFGITRLPGRVVAYDFQPHGLVFAAPVTIRHTSAGTNMTQVAASALQGAYFPQAASLDQTFGTASVTEFRPTTVAADRSSVTFTAGHFSGYLVSSGRQQ